MISTHPHRRGAARAVAALAICLVPLGASAAGPAAPGAVCTIAAPPPTRGERPIPPVLPPRPACDSDRRGCNNRQIIAFNAQIDAYNRAATDYEQAAGIYVDQVNAYAKAAGDYARCEIDDLNAAQRAARAAGRGGQ